MDGTLAVEGIFILALVVANGLLALAEIAVVSARKVRLKQAADAGRPGARTALALAEDPGRFLSTVQVGITLVGILAGVFGGATLTERLADGVARSPALAPYADALALGAVVAGITYLSLVLGELVPKRLGLAHAEAVAVAAAPWLERLSRLAAPLVWLLDVSTEAVLKVIPARASEQPEVTDEDVALLIEQGRQIGVFESIEKEMIDRLFRLSDRRVSALLTPRVDVEWIDLEASDDEVRHTIAESGHGHLPVARGGLDDIVGVVNARALLNQLLRGEPVDVAGAMSPPLLVPELLPALELLERFRSARTDMAIVIDEYGGAAGVVTLTDVLEAIAGDFGPGLTEGDDGEAIVAREDGSWLVDGQIALDDLEARLGLRDGLPGADERGYHTLAGFVISELGRIPAVGDAFVRARWRYEVVDMDGPRVDRVLVQPARVGD